MSIAIARVEGKVFNTNTHEFSSSVRKKKAVQYRKQHQTGMKWNRFQKSRMSRGLLEFGLWIYHVSILHWFRPLLD